MAAYPSECHGSGYLATCASRRFSAGQPELMIERERVEGSGPYGLVCRACKPVENMWRKDALERNTFGHDDLSEWVCRMRCTLRHRSAPVNVAGPRDCAQRPNGSSSAATERMRCYWTRRRPTQGLTSPLASHSNVAQPGTWFTPLQPRQWIDCEDDTESEATFAELL